MDVAVFLLVIFPISVLSQTLQESGPGLVRPSQQLKLTCTVSGFELSSYGVHWVRQFNDKKLEWIGVIWSGGSVDLADSLKNRVSITRDVAKKQVDLQMDRMEAKDTGLYYCARGGVFDIWGPGTTVTVTSAEQSAPSLFPLISCGTSQDSTVTIGCLAKDFLPDSISINWTDKSNGSYTNGYKTFNSVMQTTGTYATSSQIKVTSNSWDKLEPFYCVAKSTINTKSIKLVKREVETRKPIVTMNPPLKDDLELNGHGIIVCIASGFYPQAIKMSWRENHKETTFHTKTEEVSPDGSGNFTIRSFITVSKKVWNEDAVISCIVEHPASGFTEMRNLSKSQVCESISLPDELQVIAIPPSFESIFLTKTAQLTCLVSNMGSVDGLDISWYVQGTEEKLSTTLDNPTYQDNGTFSAKAVASVCVDDWLKKTFVCKVKHPELATLKQVILFKEKYQELRTPTLSLYGPQPDELNKKETITLTCLVTGFYPMDIMVRWYNGDNGEEKHVVNTAPVVDINGSKGTTYFMVSKLTLQSAEDWNGGGVYTIMVGHESLPLQATQRSIDKTSGKPTSVNVSLIMSDSC